MYPARIVNQQQTFHSQEYHVHNERNEVASWWMLRDWIVSNISDCCSTPISHYSLPQWMDYSRKRIRLKPVVFQMSAFK